MGSQTLELKWANHKSNMTSELQELYLSDALLDVTIACGEFSLKAHKTVLSASSTFFRKLFIDNPCKHPILIMTDVDFEDLKTIIEFMYQGEIHISREKLTQFLKTADKLKIKGLSSIEDMNLNPPEQHEIEVDPHYSSGAWEHSSIQPELSDTAQVENVHSSPKELTDCVQSDTNQEIPAVKVEHDLPHPNNDNCMYWQSECFDQTSSSSVLPDCNLPSSSVSLQLPAPSASHQLPASAVPHQLSTSSVSHQQSVSSISHQQPSSSVSHQQSTPSMSHQQPAPSVSQQSASHQIASASSSRQLANIPISQQLGVPLSNERFTYSESQTESLKNLVQVQEESAGKEIIPVNLYQSQDQSPIAIPSSSKSFEATESLSNQSSSQGGKTGQQIFGHDKICITHTQSDERLLHHGQIGCWGFTKKQHCSNLHKCDICKKEFIRGDILERHMKLHSKEKQFVCSICDYRFNSLARLDEHTRKHTGEKPFECNVCFRKFARQSYLYCHKRTHTGERPYECHVCHKCFSQRSNLTIHKRKHTGERPYECDLCLAKFSFSSGLSQHRKLHHKSGFDEQNKHPSIT